MKMRTLRCVAPLLLVTAISGCADKADDCHYLRTCIDTTTGGTGSTKVVVGTGGTVNVGGSIGMSGSVGSGGAVNVGGNVGSGGSAATGGAVGSGGDIATGGSIATGGVVGSGGDVATGGIATGGVVGIGGSLGTGGNLGTGGVITCSPECQGTTPVCLKPTLTCVQCTGNQHCSNTNPVCDLTRNTCVACLGDQQCSGAQPHCDLAKSVCVECTGDAQCAGSKPHCDLSKNACVECTGDTQCSGTRPFCDLGPKTCAECLDSADCTSPTASLCIAGTCSPCATNTDCSHITGKSICKPMLAEADAGAETGTCVECTGTQYAACSGDAGTARVCNSLTNTCSDEFEHSAGLCQPCISDAQCALGELCVEQKVNGVSAGHFCFWKQGDTTNGAPADCTLARPYVKIVEGAVSIDGSSATMCGLRVSSCTALNQFSQTSCASATNTANDALCGVAPGIDSKCEPYGTSQFRCSVTCLSADDCKLGVGCNAGVNPNVCKFQ